MFFARVRKPFKVWFDGDFTIYHAGYLETKIDRCIYTDKLCIGALYYSFCSGFSRPTTNPLKYVKSFQSKSKKEVINWNRNVFIFILLLNITDTESSSILLLSGMDRYELKLLRYNISVVIFRELS